MEILDLKPNVDVQEAEYKRLLGFPSSYVFEGRVRELADWARKWFRENGRPWIYARQADFELADERLRINGAVLNSKRLHDQLLDAQATEAMLVMVSAGKECEEKAGELWREGKPDEYFFLEVFGSAVVEHLVTTAGAQLCAWAEKKGMAVLPHYSPGYSGWDVADQSALFGLISKTRDHTLPQEVRVLESGPYRNSMPQVEDVSRLQPKRLSPESANGSANSGLNTNAAYTINPRALRKWSHDRLHLRILADGSVEAQFRYEGTTCSNLGRPIECDYKVRLGSRDKGYRVIDAICAPVMTDTGFEQMCEYLSNPEALKTSIAREKPLLGRPLDEVLTWQRHYSPAGCYCDVDSRNHKWGLVLEVIHYSLAQHEKQIATSANGERAEKSELIQTI